MSETGGEAMLYSTVTPPEVISDRLSDAATYHVKVVPLFMLRDVPGELTVVVPYVRWSTEMAGGIWSGLATVTVTGLAVAVSSPDVPRARTVWDTLKSSGFVCQTFCQNPVAWFSVQSCQEALLMHTRIGLVTEAPFVRVAYTCMATSPLTVESGRGDTICTNTLTGVLPLAAKPLECL